MLLTRTSPPLEIRDSQNGESALAGDGVGLGGMPLELGFAHDWYESGGLTGSKMARLAHHIDANLYTSLRLIELASLVGLSVHHFSRAFKKRASVSPHAYVMRRRLQRAQFLMLTTDSPLGQVAFDCGFADQSHLSKVFRKHVGETPGVWRRANRRNASR